MIDHADFYTVGGTLRPKSSSYVERPADQELFKFTEAGELCYVLTSRQMGKSSLMVRTAARLRERGARPVIIDLTRIGTVDIDQWYLGLFSRIRSDLRLNVDVTAWWEQHSSLGPPQRFGEFLREVVLMEVPDPIVIFIDEIDSTLKLDFRDDFFAAVRAVYNERASYPAYKRLTFVLLGVAAPSDLIADPNRTPFNIGRRIVLADLDYSDAQVLKPGLEASHPGQADLILHRIFHWTNGHPYLTQKLCAEAARRPTRRWSRDEVDDLVQEQFFSDERKDDNLSFIQDRLMAEPVGQRRKLIKLYRDVYTGKEVKDDERSVVQNHLELSGLVRVERGRLHVRNEIYRQAFDQAWMRASLPRRRGLQVAALASALALAAVLAAVYFLSRPPAGPAELAQLQMENFRSSQDAGVRLQALRTLFQLGYDQEALGLFYSLSPEQQIALFSAPLSLPMADQVLADVIHEIAPTLDRDLPDGHGDALLARMRQAAGEHNQFPLVNELLRWSQGRALAANDPAAALEEYNQAIELYKAAAAAATAQPTPLALYSAPPAALIERAQLYAALGQPEAALDDFEAAGNALSAGSQRDNLPTPIRSADEQARLAAARAANPLLDFDTTSDAMAKFILADEALWRVLSTADGAERYPILARSGVQAMAQQAASATALAQTAAAQEQATATARAGFTATAQAEATATARAVHATTTALAADPDRDGLTTGQELELGTDPHNPDSDNDGELDGEDRAPLATSTPLPQPTPQPTQPPTSRPAAPTQAPQPQPTSPPPGGPPSFPTPDLG